MPIFAAASIDQIASTDNAAESSMARFSAKSPSTIRSRAPEFDKNVLKLRSSRGNIDRNQNRAEPGAAQQYFDEFHPV